VEAGEFAQVVAEISVANLPERRRTDTALTALLTQMARGVGWRGLLRQLDAQRTRPDSRRFLDRITCPTLVVSGSEDHVCPPALQSELVEGLPAARLATIEGSGHMTPLEAYRELAALLSEWLD
jgi:pimeloyl-ACP methyl ester carboxylesterase